MASKTNATGRAKKTNATGKKSAPKPKATGSKKSAEVGSKNPAGENAADGENAHNTRYKMRAQVLKRHGEVVKNYAALAGGHAARVKTKRHGSPYSSDEIADLLCRLTDLEKENGELQKENGELRTLLASKEQEDANGTNELCRVLKYVLEECRKWNLVWVGLNKVAPLEPDEMEFLLGFPKDHTRGISRTERGHTCYGESSTTQINSLEYQGVSAGVQNEEIQRVSHLENLLLEVEPYAPPTVQKQIKAAMRPQVETNKAAKRQQVKYLYEKHVGSKIDSEYEEKDVFDINHYAISEENFVEAFKPTGNMHSDVVNAQLSIWNSQYHDRIYLSTYSAVSTFMKPREGRCVRTDEGRSGC
ncbi:hypothetical protein HU200_008954 [Digitaria exilis]|uniref:Uncharacterized protein n=1 Tax=Digitaria exilis TaxID=1010633 RepID=A0A835FLA2_9POAL|nr:hypothetical protein HU200_008954 [Digitaria exilis]